MDRVDHVPRLCIPAEAGARSERKRLGAFDRRGIVRDQEEPRRGIGAGELTHLSQLRQGADVEDRYVWTVSAQHDSNPPVLHIGSDNQETRIALNQLAQSPGEEIVEVGEDYGDGGLGRHRAAQAWASAYVFIDSNHRKGEPRLTSSSPATPPKTTLSGGRTGRPPASACKAWLVSCLQSSSQQRCCCPRRPPLTTARLTPR